MIQVGRKIGMATMKDAIDDLVAAGHVTEESAREALSTSTSETPEESKDIKSGPEPKSNTTKF